MPLGYVQRAFLYCGGICGRIRTGRVTNPRVNRAVKIFCKKAEIKEGNRK